MCVRVCVHVCVYVCAVCVHVCVCTCACVHVCVGVLVWVCEAACINLHGAVILELIKVLIPNPLKFDIRRRDCCRTKLFLALVS